MGHTVYTGDEHHDGGLAVDIDNDGDFDIVSIGWVNDKVVLYENTARAPLRGDIKIDCRVDSWDMMLFAERWVCGDCNGPQWCGRADVDRSGKIDFADFSLLVQNWLLCCNYGCD
jgi:hypothetical protein